MHRGSSGMLFQANHALVEWHQGCCFPWDGDTYSAAWILTAAAGPLPWLSMEVWHSKKQTCVFISECVYNRYTMPPMKWEDWFIVFSKYLTSVGEFLTFTIGMYTLFSQGGKNFPQSQKTTPPFFTHIWSSGNLIKTRKKGRGKQDILNQINSVQTPFSQSPRHTGRKMKDSHIYLRSHSLPLPTDRSAPPAGRIWLVTVLGFFDCTLTENKETANLDSDTTSFS